MNVLFLIDSLGSGGAQRQIVTLSKMLKDIGYNVSVLCYTYANFFAEYLEEADIPIHWVNKSNYIERIFSVRRFIRRGNYDAVISFLDVPNFLNCFAAIGGRSWKVITSERSSKKELLRSRQGRIFAWFQRYSDAIVCNSNNAKEMWIEYYPRYKNKLEVIYNPVILPTISSKYISKRNGKLHIVVAASYQYLKNPIGLIKALILLNENERKKIKVDWYGRIEVTKGDRRAYDDAVSLIEDNNLHDIIQLHKPTTDILNKMNEADVVALFSELEGLPNAICEGMMLGKPIIMSKVSDYDQLIDESNGVLCDWDNPESIRDAILYMAQLTKEELIEKGKQSILKAENLFSSEGIVSQWIKLIG
jgi:glycosyltransferase involved in cell wall biosynthesis